MIGTSFTTEKHPLHKDRRIARSWLAPAALGYPKLYVEVEYKVNPKTGLINPATKDQDLKVRCAPYGGTLTDAFNAPAHGVEKTLYGPIAKFSFPFTVEIGDADVHLNIKDIFSIDKKIAPYRGMVMIEGDLNTVTGDGSCHSRKV